MANYFDPKFEQESIDRGIAQQQGETGVWVDWWFWDPKDSRISNVYDEDIPGASRHWRGPHPMPVLQASRTMGTMEDSGEGAYQVDMVSLVLGYHQALQRGLSPVDFTAKHLKDRFVFEGKVWNPSSIVARNLLGGNDRRRSTVMVVATEVKPDELVNDDQFQRYAEPDYVDPTPGSVAF